MVPFDVVTGRDYMASRSGSVIILRESFKMFSLPILISYTTLTHKEHYPGHTQKAVGDLSCQLLSE